MNEAIYRMSKNVAKSSLGKPGKLLNNKQTYMMGHPSVSVIIPCYNSKDYVANAIASAYGQTFPPKEVIVVDDGSTDGSFELLIDLKRTTYHSLIILFHPDHINLGESISRSLGLSKATGDYTAMLDADDLFDPRKLASQIELLEQNPQAVLCHTAVECIGNTQWADYFEAAFNSNDETPYFFRDKSDYLVRNHICNSSVMVRTALLKTVPFATLAINGYQDWLCWCLLAEKGQFIFLDQQFTSYRVHSGSTTSKLVNNKLLRLYASLEFRLALFVRTGKGFHAARVLLSCMNTFHEIIIEYLWYPGYQPQGATGNLVVKKNHLIIALLASFKAFRLLRRFYHSLLKGLKMRY